MKKFELDWLNQYAGQLALLGFDQYLKHGKGTINVTLLPGLEPKLNYVNGSNDPHYDPNTQVLIKINDNPIERCTHNTDMRKVHGQMMLR